MELKKFSWTYQKSKISSVGTAETWCSLGFASAEHRGNVFAKGLRVWRATWDVMEWLGSVIFRDFTKKNTKTKSHQSEMKSMIFWELSGDVGQ